MPLIKNGAVVADPFVAVGEEAAVPDGGPVLVTADRLLADPAALLARPAPVGVVWPNDKDVAELAPFLARLAVVALVFPSFRDGRAYSQARILRERYGFGGELRATGQVLRDQFVFLTRAGFDALNIAKDADADAFAAALARYSGFYQRIGAAGRPPAQQRPSGSPKATA